VARLRLPTGIFRWQITQIWHFSKAFGSENCGLAVWYLGTIFVFATEICNLAATLTFEINLASILF